MQFIIVTGMSGAGKSLALKFLEDIGFFCVDNLPPPLIGEFAKICGQPGSGIERAAIGVDIRGGKLFDGFFPGIKTINDNGYQYSVLFLDCADEVLLKRYKESRRSHPLTKGDRIIDGIERERRQLTEIKALAAFTIDTTDLLTKQLKEKINNIFSTSERYNNITINILSFGFKYGIPMDSDMVFDVRFIPNPFYIKELSELTGNDERIREFVLGYEVSKMFLHKLKETFEFLIPNFIEEGKSQLVISIGCTGGKHRSVTFANELYSHLKNMGHKVFLMHRDILK